MFWGADHLPDDQLGGLTLSLQLLIACNSFMDRVLRNFPYICGDVNSCWN